MNVPSAAAPVSQALHPIVGGWRLADWRTEYSDGRAPTLPFGDNPQGLLVYSPDGWMNASICRPNRPAMSSASLKHAPAHERLDAIDSFMNYGGPYSFPDSDHVRHEVVIALYPNLIGTDQVRRMRFEGGDTLILSAQDTLPGTSVRRTHSLTWKRAAP
jgi:hypothetical protein